MNKIKFTMKIDDKDVELAVRKPTHKEITEAERIMSRTFGEALKSGALLRDRLDAYARQQGVWDDEKQKRFDELQKSINDNEKKFVLGGGKFADAKAAAIQCIEDREEIKNLIFARTTLDSYTAEGQAENAKYNYLLSVCTVYNDSNKPYCITYEDYLNKLDDPVMQKASGFFAKLYYGRNPDDVFKLPEIKFLKEFGLVNDNGRLVDKQNRLVDRLGRHIDENNRLIRYNDDDTIDYIDVDGNIVDIDGNLKDIQRKPFED